jgi:hypothetical protein
MVLVKGRSRVTFWSSLLLMRFQVALLLTAIVLILFFFHLRFRDDGVDFNSLDNFLQERGASGGGRLGAQKPFSMQEERKAAQSYVKSFNRLGRPLIFFHIPKTAGTAIEFAAGSKRIPWGSCLFKHKPKRDICRYPGGQECKW